MKLFKILIRVIIFALAVGLVGLLIYGIWRLLSSHWKGVLFWVYCIGVMITFIIQLWFLALTKRIDNPVGQELLMVRLFQAAEPTNKFKFWRNRLNTLLSVISAALVWPQTLLLNGLRSRKLNFADKRLNILLNAAYQRLHPLDVQISVITLALILLIYAIHLFFAFSPQTGTRFLLLMAIYATIKVASYTVNPIPLAAQLRRGPGNAYIDFLIIAFAIYAILTLSFAGYINGISAVRFESVKDITLDMLKFRKAYSLFQGGSLTFIDYFVTVSGFLYYISLFQVILRLNQFKRTDEDYNFIAQSYVTLSKFNEVLTWLGKVTVANPMTLELKAHAYLGVNQLSKAMELAKQAHFLRKNEQLDDNGTFRFLVNSACMYPLPVNSIIQLLEQWIKTGVKDAEFMTLSAALIGQGRITNEQYEKALITPQVISNYPLSHIASLLRAGELLSAHEALLAMPPTSGMDEVVRRYLILQVSVSDPNTDTAQDRAAFESWATEHLSEVFRIARELPDDERLFLIGYLSMLEPLARKLLPEREEEFRFLLQDLRNSITAEGLQGMSLLMNDVFQRTVLSS